MASLISHGIVAGAIGACWQSEDVPRRALVGGIVAAMVPDLDVIGFPFGIAYGDPLGHRGFSHSLLFAALVAALLATALRPGTRRAWWRVSAFLSLAVASHGILDAMTDGGLGVAFFAPFSNQRYFLPWRPIPVSPIGLRPFLSARGAEVLRAEALWLWLPAGLLMVAALRRRHRVVSRAP